MGTDARDSLSFSDKSTISTRLAPSRHTKQTHHWSSILMLCRPRRSPFSASGRLPGDQRKSRLRRRDRGNILIAMYLNTMTTLADVLVH